MNPFLIVIVSALIVNFILNLTAESLNLKSIKPKLPPEVKDFYDENQYRRSQEYLVVNTRLGFLSDTFELILIFGFWFASGFNTLDQIVRSWEFNSIISGLLYIAILLLGRGFVMLGFRIYSTFVIEERFGFNKTDRATFALDLAKGLFISLAFGAPILGLIFWFLESAGNWAPLFCWSSFTIYLLTVQYIAPMWIMTLFHKFTPIEDGPLKDTLLTYAQSVNFPLTQIYVIDGSRRSSKANAFFTGFGKNKRVALFDTLVEQQSIPEIESVLAHEIGHYKNKHIFKNLIFSLIHMGILFYCLSIFLTNRELFNAFFIDNISVYVGLVLFGVLFSPIEAILSIIIQMISRRYEREADRFAFETTSNPECLVNALKKLSVNNLTNLTPHPFYVFINHSHPPVLERIHAIRSSTNYGSLAK